MPDWNGEELGFTATTPNGMVVQYEPRPKRLYRIGWEQAELEVVPSVTEILRCLDKPALTWWGQCVGLAGGLELYLRGVTPEMLLNGKPEDQPMVEWAKPIARGVLTEYRLTTSHIRDTASSRGQTVHSAFSYWATTGMLPIPAEYPEHEQAYVIALIKFLQAVPTLEPLEIELAVGSVEHGFAGRFDLRGKTTEAHKVVTKVYPKVDEKTTRIPAGVFLFDLKTSTDIYPEHSLQLGGYELASIESGYEPTDGQVVVQLGDDGRYQCRRAHSTGEDFLAVKACWHALKRADKDMKIPYRPEVAA